MKMKKAILGLLLVSCSYSSRIQVTTVKLMGINPINMGASGQIGEHGASIHPDYTVKMPQDSIQMFLNSVRKLEICDTCDGFSESFVIKIRLKEANVIVLVHGSKYGNVRSNFNLEKIDTSQIETLCYPYTSEVNMDLFSLYQSRNAPTYHCIQSKDSVIRIFSNLKKRALQKESRAINEWLGISFLNEKKEVLYLSFSREGFISANHKFYKLDSTLWQLIKIHLPQNVLSNLPYYYQKLNTDKN
jgi:hypothetical protein